MAKLTLAELKTLATSYVSDTLQTAVNNPTVNDLTKMLNKIAKTITLVGDENIDYLPELDGEELPYGNSIEEYFVDFVMPIAFDPDGKNTLAPHRPTFEECAYNYRLGKKNIPVTIDNARYETGLRDAKGVADLVADIMNKFSGSSDAFKISCKKQLLGNLGTHISEATNAAELVSEISAPTDTTTGEAFIKLVKTLKSKAKKMNAHNLAGAVNKGASTLYLYIKEGIIPSLEVDTLAGAFNLNMMGMNVEVKEVEDFGDNATYYALLVDSRAIKLHTNKDRIDDQLNAEGHFHTYYRLVEYLGYISKFGFVHAFKNPA